MPRIGFTSVTMGTESSRSAYRSGKMHGECMDSIALGAATYRSQMTFLHEVAHKSTP